MFALFLLALSYEHTVNVIKIVYFQILEYTIKENKSFISLYNILEYEF